MRFGRLKGWFGQLVVDVGTESGLEDVYFFFLFPFSFFLFRKRGKKGEVSCM